MAWLNLAAMVSCTDAEGPGRRAALWVQGCDKRCAGCCNARYLPIVERELVAADTVVEQLAAAQQRFALEGVTLLGGEPMLQAQGLARVAAGCQDLGLSVLVFTGYTHEELTALALPGVSELLTHTDVLVDGPYMAERPEQHRNWVGSQNQRFHYLSARYDHRIERDPAGAPSIEIRFKSDGSAQLNGWPVSFTKTR